MNKMRYVLFQSNDRLEFVSIPASYAYQLSALNLRLQKEVGKLTAKEIPTLPKVIAECDALELLDPQYAVISGLDYINHLENNFSSIEEKTYPLISLLTEIRALQAQLEQWYEEEYIQE